MARRQAERLIDVKIRQEKPHATKAVILPDGKGLRLAIFPNGARYWQLGSARDGKERTIQIGTYPQMPLTKARKEAEKVREAIYSLIGSAKLNGIDPEAYLRFVLARIADYPVNRVADLLPWAVADQLANDSAERPVAT